MSDNEQIRKNAIEYARKNKKKLANQILWERNFKIAVNPISVFMAGSPGAGKTETAERLVEEFEDDIAGIIHIDPDKYRALFKDYNGRNSFLFQGAVSIIADKVHDIALKGYNFIFDSTLTNFKKAKLNIKRSLKRDREVEIFYVYQDPVLAWGFVQEREKEEGRHVPKDSFVKKYFTARENVNNLKSIFDKNIEVHLIVKDYIGQDLRYEQNIDNVDGHLPERYDEKKLRAKLEQL